LPVDEIFNESTTDVVPQGQSRKKVVSRTVEFTPEFEAWSKAYDLALQEISSTAQYCATPFMRTEWLTNGYFVDICVPIEVRDIYDLAKLVNLVKRLLKRETTLELEFPNFTYTKTHWFAEATHHNKTVEFI
jgi:hypothetical protein